MVGGWIHLGHLKVDHGGQQLVGDLWLLETEDVANLVHPQGGNDQVAPPVEPRRFQRQCLITIGLVIGS